MKNRLKIFGNIWHDTGIVFIATTFLICILYGWMLGFPEGFPDQEHVSPILWTSLLIAVWYLVTYRVIDLKIQSEDLNEDEE